MNAADRARRLAAGDTRSRTECLADALRDLVEVIERESDPVERVRSYGAALGFVRHRAREAYVQVTGQEP